MILAGFNCHNCGADVIDSIDHCYNCKTPYVGMLASTAQAHHQEKLAMIAVDAGREVSSQRIMEKVGELASVSLSIAAIERAGCQIDAALIPVLFHER